MFFPVGGVLAASLLATVVSAQNSSLPAGFDPGLVSPDEKSSWCDGQSNTCVKVCEFASVNRCNPGTLSYECKCQDGTTPDMSQYMGSLPFYICQANFGQCIKNNPSDADAQQACKDAKKKCGSRNATEIDHGSATTSSEISEPTGTDDDDEDDADETDTNAAATTTTDTTPTPTDNAAVMQIAQNYSLGLLISVFLAVFGYLV